VKKFHAKAVESSGGENLLHAAAEVRGQGGDDAEEKLITLCAACHSRVHLI